MSEESTSHVTRRDFIRLASSVGVAMHTPLSFPFARYAPADKGTSASLLESGVRKFLSGKDLRYVGMPVGGLCTGTVYLGGDGRLWLWDIFNEIKLGVINKQVTFHGDTINPLGGANYVQPPEQTHPFDQGIGIRVESEGAPTVKVLEHGDWNSIEFLGEYPKAIHRYSDPQSPVTVEMETHSPYCPLDTEASSLPLVIRKLKVTNHSGKPVKVSLGAWVENPVCLHTAPAGLVKRTVRGEKDRLILEAELNPPKAKPRKPVVFETWDSESFEGWTVEGDAFGSGPQPKAQYHIKNGPGTRVAKSYNPRQGDTNVVADARTGRLTSKTFTIDRNFVEIWIGGGNKPNTACALVVVEGGPTIMLTGRQSDELRMEMVDLREHLGKKAHIEIVDKEREFWGQIGVGQIRFVDELEFDLDRATDFGSMALQLIGGTPKPGATRSTIFEHSGTTPVSAASPERPSGSVVSKPVELGPGKSHEFEVRLAWHFPNLVVNGIGEVGHYYASKADSASKVLDNAPKHDFTDLWHKTWYDSTLPKWYVQRVMDASSTLSTMTCVRFKNGRFYAWEGIGCCDGTCGHVWQYAQSMARLYPELERSVREMAELNPKVGFLEESGIVNFRGEYGHGYAADSQAGYVLRTYREHMMCADDRFLKRVYKPIKKVLEFLIREDKDGNGVLEGRQHNTLDVDLYGPSSWLTSMYLAALRAGEEMATEMGDDEFAETCRNIFKKGVAAFDKLFFNGEYYIHVLDKPSHLDAMRIGNGCHVDQLLGQWWAHQLGLGRIAPEKASRTAMKSLFKYNFIPDVGPFREKQKPGRWYAVPGETGLVTTAFPFKDKDSILGPTPTWASMYFNECWTGVEYSAAAEMIYEGLVEEGLRVVKAVVDRHAPEKRNPYNEVECSDHYARGMSVYSTYLALCGYYYHGPKGVLGFAPKMTPEKFKAAFTAAEGWGSFEQKVSAKSLDARVSILWGQLKLSEFRLDPGKHSRTRVEATVAGKPVEASIEPKGGSIAVRFTKPITIRTNEELTIRLS